jgi:hypothetical protein
MSTIAPELYRKKVRVLYCTQSCTQYNQYCGMNAYYYFLHTKIAFYYFTVQYNTFESRYCLPLPRL